MQKWPLSFGAVHFDHYLICNYQDRGFLAMKRDTRNAWPSLASIEQVGLSEYPGLAALAYHPVTAVDARIVDVLKAQRSLIIRLVVRRPLRGQDLCALKIHENLRCDNGRWTMEFRTAERAWSQVCGQPDVYRMSFPPDLAPQLEEFLAIWRPLLPGDDLPELFTTRTGQAFDTLTLNREIAKAFRQRPPWAIGLPQLRSIWATEFLASTHNFSGAAALLDDVLETVLRRYGRVRYISERTTVTKHFAHPGGA
jgi:hypothetical protein